MTWHRLHDDSSTGRSSAFSNSKKARIHLGLVASSTDQETDPSEPIKFRTLSVLGKRSKINGVDLVFGLPPKLQIVEPAELGCNLKPFDTKKTAYQLGRRRPRPIDRVGKSGPEANCIAYPIEPTDSRLDFLSRVLELRLIATTSVSDVRRAANQRIKFKLRVDAKANLISYASFFACSGM